MGFFPKFGAIALGTASRFKPKTPPITRSIGFASFNAGAPFMKRMNSINIYLYILQDLLLFVGFKAHQTSDTSARHVTVAVLVTADTV